MENINSRDTIILIINNHIDYIEEMTKYLDKEYEKVKQDQNIEEYNQIKINNEKLQEERINLLNKIESARTDMNAIRDATNIKIKSLEEELNDRRKEIDKMTILV